jgi:hypothetical protein
MSGLGLGMIAGAAAIEEQKRQEIRDREAQRFNWERQQKEADLSLLGDKTDSERSRLKLGKAQSEAGLEVLPGATANTIREQQIKGFGLDTKAQTQPFERRAAVSDAKVKAETSEFEVQGLPDKLSRAATQGVIDQQGQSDVVLGTIGRIMSRHDKAGALAFANKIAKVGNILPNTNGKTFTDIVPGAKGDGYEFHTDDGNKVFVPTSAIYDAMQKLESKEYQFLHTSDGSVFSANKRTGAVTQTHKGDPKVLRGQHTPAEIQTMEYLVSKGVAQNTQQAWEMVRSSREKTRNSFIADFVAKNAFSAKDAPKVAEQAGQIYDSLRQNQQQPGAPAPARGANTPAPGTMDPELESLLGIN